MREYLATYYILKNTPKLPRHTLGLDAIVINHRFIALTKSEADKMAKVRIDQLKLEYKEAKEIKHVSTELAPDYVN